LLILHAKPTDEEEGPGESPTIELDVDHDNEGEGQISIYALAGYMGPRTTLVKGRIGYCRVTVLIDSGSTHNFIDQKLSRCLGLSVKPIEFFWVTVANGEKLGCHERHDEVGLLIQDLEITTTFYSLPLNGLDVLLGIQWLAKLGPIICDWSKLSMTITREGRTFETRSFDLPLGQAVSNALTGHEVASGGEVFAVAVQPTQSQPACSIPDAIQVILLDFPGVMEEPKALPPSRAYDHRIILKDGSEPINVRPYRYAHFQKAEIERQVTDMLISGLIRPSTSPFSSPILLVNKKGWHVVFLYRLSWFEHGNSERSLPNSNSG
jgi:hypothetical protein